MNNAANEFPRDAGVESAAAEWLVQQDRGLTPAQQDAFLQWLAADPRHRESFQRHCALWGNFDALAQWRPQHSAEPNPDLLARPRSHAAWRWLAPSVLAAAAAVAFIAWIGQPTRNADPLAFEATAYRQEQLPDGSLVDLNRGAHVVVQFSPGERRVVLVQGEAQFTVAKNPARPFVVRAGGIDVRAVGTAFNVKLAGPNLELLVTEGRVQVAQQAAGEAATHRATPAKPGPTVLAALSAGERTIIGVAAKIEPPVVRAVSPREVDELLLWKPRLLDFESVPLAEVIAEFNRRNPVRLAIGDDSLRTLPIVASIRSDNVEGFLRMLEATMGVRVERRPEGLILLRRAPQP